MSEAAGAIRSTQKISNVKCQHKQLLQDFTQIIRIPSGRALHRAYQLKEALVSQQMYLSAMEDYARNVGGSRGSAIYTASDGELAEGLEELFRFRLDDGGFDDQVQIVEYEDNEPKITWRLVRPLPQENEAFETIWKKYRETKNVD